jgi:hypothetical protein
MCKNPICKLLSHIELLLHSRYLRKKFRSPNPAIPLGPKHIFTPTHDNTIIIMLTIENNDPFSPFHWSSKIHKNLYQTLLHI